MFRDAVNSLVLSAHGRLNPIQIAGSAQFVRAGTAHSLEPLLYIALLRSHATTGKSAAGLACLAPLRRSAAELR
jgi:hypothetical protein